MYFIVVRGYRCQANELLKPLVVLCVSEAIAMTGLYTALSLLLNWDKVNIVQFFIYTTLVRWSEDVTSLNVRGL